MGNEQAMNAKDIQKRREREEYMQKCRKRLTQLYKEKSREIENDRHPQKTFHVRQLRWNKEKKRPMINKESYIVDTVNETDEEMCRLEYMFKIRSISEMPGYYGHTFRTIPNHFKYLADVSIGIHV